MRNLADHILDIVQNSIRANATLIEIMVNEDKKEDICNVVIADNGSGMDKDMLERATDPFFTSRNTRKVGLGLSLFKQNAEQANGKFKLSSELGKGTVVEARFQLSNMDTPPLGDIWDTYYLTLISCDAELDYSHKTNVGEFVVRSAEIKEMLGGVSLREKEVKNAIIELIRNNLLEIRV